jgi:hypothetical protein
MSKQSELTPAELDTLFQALTALRDGRQVDAWVLAKLPVLQAAYEKMKLAREVPS